MPGKDPSFDIRFCTEGEYLAISERHLHSACYLIEHLGRSSLELVVSLVVSCSNEVCEHLGILRIDYLGCDLEVVDLVVAAQYELYLISA